MTQKMKQIIALHCLFLLYLNVWSQTYSGLDTIVVQTTRIPQKALETGRNVSIIDAETIQKMAFTSLDDLLQYIPGIEVQSRNAFGAQGDISMRGATFTQVLVLVDGMKLNDPLTAHFNSYIPVPPAEIERIEVLRGPAAAIYGADAVGGVINIITKAFSSNSSNTNEVSGQINYGENRLVNAQQGFSIKKNRLYLGGGFSMNQSDGALISARTIISDADTTVLEGYNNFFNIKTIGFSFGYDFKNDWRLVGRTAYDDRDFSARYFYTTSVFDKSVETTRNWWNQVQLSKTGAASKTDFNLAYRNGTDRFVFSPDFPSTNIHTTKFWNFNVNHLQIINEGLNLNFGAQIDRRSIESTDRGNHNDLHYGIYAMGLFRPLDNLSLSASLRLDYDENYGTEFTPQATASYTLNNLSLRAAAGRSIRAADYTERYVSFNLENLTPGRSLGNPNLAAEQAWSEEIGFDYQVSNAWQLKATAFFRQSSSLIDYVSTNTALIPNNQNLQDGANYFYATNIIEVQTNGFELESWFNYTINEKNSLAWSLGYTYLNTSNEEEVLSVYISSHAGHLLNTNLILDIDVFSIAINGLYKQRTARLASAINASLAPSYQVWNLRMGYQLRPEFGLNFQIHNAFDQDYQDILGAPMPGRWLMGGLQFKL